MSAASGVILGVTKLILRALGGYQSSGRAWFNRRTTNLIGLAVVALYTGGVGLRLAWLNGWIEWLRRPPCQSPRRMTSPD